MRLNLVNVRGTELLASDTRDQYRQKLARITLDSMVQFVGLLDARGTVLEINKVALDAVGIKLSDVEGKPFWTTFWWQVSAEINAMLQESIRRASQGEFVRWDTEIYGRVNGKETIIIDASLMPVKDEQGNVVFIAAEGRDITEKKAHEREIARQREELAELDKLKTQFFANISHEFRTPLTLMMGPLEDALAASEGLTSSNRERLELAHRNSLRLLKLVNTLLDFSRIEAGRIQASYEPTDLALLTAELASVFRSAIERAGMRLVINCPALPEMVYVDREMWEKVVLNLLSNAFKFTFEGEIEVSLRQIDSTVEMTVRDTGTGIPANEIPGLFERFHRVKGVRGRSYEGSGIGLALVQELVKLHGGNVRATSEVDRGTAFTVTIPLGSAHLSADRIGGARVLASTGLRGEAYVQEALRWLPGHEHPVGDVEATSPASLSEAPSHPARASEQAARILLADDNADMRDYVQRLLSAQYEVVAVADGESALNSARQRRPDLILSDIMMPRLDGFGLLRAVRSDQDLKSIPVVLLSARSGEESRVEGLDAGADDYLVKPFSARELVARVGAHLAMARIRRESEEQFRTLSERLDAEVRVRTRELEERSGDLLKQSERMRDLSRRLLQTQDEERRHIARELHDSAGQTLTVLAMNLEQLLREIQERAPDIAKHAEASKQLAYQLHQEIRTTSYLLHPPLLDETGLVPALAWYTQGLSDRSGISIDLRIPENFGRIPRDIELVVFRLVQECLTNIHRHSGAKGAVIRIVRAQDSVSVEVSDDGRGMSVEKLAEVQQGGSGVGLGGMRERVHQFRGDMKIESNASGTKILVNIPSP
ncbi:MAG: ATP-binding protein [Candidatus Acidiferrales bacterium]